MIELERTFLAKKLPSELKQAKKKQMLDVYLPSSASHPNLRIRKNGDKYEITKKELTGNDYSKLSEKTIPLTKEEFEELITLKGKRVAKTRHVFNHNGTTCEFDVFEEELKGLVLVDFEFETEEEKKKFVMPDFCLIEVTQEEFAAGGFLAGKKYEDIEKELEKYKYAKIGLK